MKKLLIISAILGMAGCSNGNLEYVKPLAEKRWEEVGFKVVGYQGHQWGYGGFGTAYGGAKVWYELRTEPDNGVTYSGYIKRWGGSLELYGPFARDAIKPN